MPAYVCTSPSLSGLNFLIAKTSPSLAGKSPGRIHSSGLFNGSAVVAADTFSLSGGRESADRVKVLSELAVLDLAGGASSTALYTRPYVPYHQLDAVTKLYHYPPDEIKPRILYALSTLV